MIMEKGCLLVLASTDCAEPRLLGDACRLRPRPSVEASASDSASRPSAHRMTCGLYDAGWSCSGEEKLPSAGEAQVSSKADRKDWMRKQIPSFTATSFLSGRSFSCRAQPTLSLA